MPKQESNHATDTEPQLRAVLWEHAPIMPRRSVVASVASLSLIIGSITWIGCASEKDVAELASSKPAQAALPQQETYSEGQYVAQPVSGTVLDADGKPVSGAEVLLRQGILGYTSGRIPVPTKDMARIKTDANGCFRFTNVPVDEEQRWMDVVALASDHAICWKHLPGGVAHENLQFRLTKGFPLRGRVVSEDGKPVADAPVRLQYVMSIRHITQADLEEGRWPRTDDGNFIYFDGSRTPPQAMTDSDGRFTFSHVPANRGVALRVAHPRHQLTTVLTATVREIDEENASKAKRDVRTGDLQVTAKRARLLKVRVVFDDTNKPAVGARYPDFLRYISSPAKLTLDDAGEFRVPHIDRSSVGLRVYPPENSDYVGASRHVVFHQDEYERTEVIRLKRGSILTGKVVDAETGRGIGNVPVSAYSGNRVNESIGSDRPFRTLPDGTFRAAVVHGPVTLRVSGSVPGYMTRVGNAWAVSQRLTVSEAKGLKGIIMQLKRAPAVSGTVYGPNGKPAAGIPITGRVPLSKNSYQPLKDITDASGRFTLNELHPAWSVDGAPRKVEVVFRDRKNNLAGTLLIGAPKDDTEHLRTMDVHLKPLGKVTGRFINADNGQPIPGVRVTLYQQSAELGSRRSHSVSPELRTGKDGRFELTGLFGGRVQHLMVNDGRFSYFRSPRINGEYNNLVNLGDLKLAPKTPSKDLQLTQIQAPSTEGLPADRAFAMLKKQFDVDNQAYRVLRDNAKTERDTSHVVSRREPTPAYVKAFRQLADQHPDTDVELKSLVWIAKCSVVGGSSKQVKPFKKPAAEQLMEKYVDRKELSGCISSLLVYGGGPGQQDDNGVGVVTRLLQQNKHPEVLGPACYQTGRMIAFRRHRKPSQQELNVAIGFLEKAATEYAHVGYWRHGTIGKAAKLDLYELQHLVAGAVAPETSGKDLEGNDVSLNALRGKVVVLSFTMFPHDLPPLEALQKEFKDQLTVVAVMSTRNRAVEAVAKHKVSFPMIVDGDKRAANLAWNNDSWPARHIIDQNGVIRHMHVREDDTRDEVWKLLQQ